MKKCLPGRLAFYNKFPCSTWRPCLAWHPAISAGSEITSDSLFLDICPVSALQRFPPLYRHQTERRYENAEHHLHHSFTIDPLFDSKKDQLDSVRCIVYLFDCPGRIVCHCYPGFPVWDRAGFIGSTLWLIWLILVGIQFLKMKTDWYNDGSMRTFPSSYRTKVLC